MGTQSRVERGPDQKRAYHVLLKKGHRADGGWDGEAKMLLFSKCFFFLQKTCKSEPRRLRLLFDLLHSHFPRIFCEDEGRRFHCL
jgi:hypothetical protein